jgi:hypothetical protein
MNRGRELLISSPRFTAGAAANWRGRRAALLPTSASWLNAVENFFSKMTRQRIRRGVFRSVVDLQAAINAYLAEHNANPKPFVWTKSAEAILAKLDRFPLLSVRFSAVETPTANPMLGPAASAVRRRRRANLLLTTAPHHRPRRHCRNLGQRCSLLDPSRLDQIRRIDDRGRRATAPGAGGSGLLPDRSS